MVLRILSRLLAGAFPQPEHEDVPADQQYFPEGGIISAPDYEIFDNADPYGDPAGPTFTLHIAEGSFVKAGHPIAEIDTSGYIVDVTSPCDGRIAEVLIRNDELPRPNQAIARLEQSE